MLTQVKRIIFPSQQLTVGKGHLVSMSNLLFVLFVCFSVLFSILSSFDVKWNPINHPTKAHFLSLTSPPSSRYIPGKLQPHVGTHPFSYRCTSVCVCLKIRSKRYSALIAFDVVGACKHFSCFEFVSEVTTALLRGYIGSSGFTWLRFLLSAESSWKCELWLMRKTKKILTLIVSSPVIYQIRAKTYETTTELTQTDNKHAINATLAELFIIYIGNYFAGTQLTYLKSFVKFSSTTVK